MENRNRSDLLRRRRPWGALQPLVLVCTGGGRGLWMLLARVDAGAELSVGRMTSYRLCSGGGTCKRRAMLRCGMLRPCASGIAAMQS